ncbi:MAG: hypothetical protein ACLVJH_16365 [Faecalibacterium prausnitzii]
MTKGSERAPSRSLFYALGYPGGAGAPADRRGAAPTARSCPAT